MSLLADISLILPNKLPAFDLIASSRSIGCVEVGWAGYMLLGVTEIAFLESPIGCICLVSIIHICTYNMLIVILKFKVRCRYARAL